MIRAALAVTLFAVSAATFAQPIDVEVVVFARTLSADSVDEAWPDRQNIRQFNASGLPLGRYSWLPCAVAGSDCPMKEAPEQLFSVQSSDQLGPMDNGISLLATNQLQLTAARDQLARQGDYRVLLHTGWQQELSTSRTAALPVRLIGGRNFAASFGDDGYRLVKEAAPAPTTNLLDDLQSEAASELGQALPAGPAPIWELDGTFSLYNNGALIVETDLQWRQPGEVALRPELATKDSVTTPAPEPVHSDDQVQLLALNADGSGATSQPSTEPFLFAYQLEQLRKIKKGTTYYLDHPLYGVLIQVRNPQPEAAAVTPQP